MNAPRITERHERTIVRTYTKAQIEALLRKALFEELGADAWKGEPRVTVRFENETEGSPAYVVGTKAIIEVVEDLTPSPRVTGAKPPMPPSPPPPPPCRA